MSDMTEEFATALRDRRIRTGISQEELAEMAGLHRTYIGMIERCERHPTLQVARDLAVALGTSLTVLVRESEKRMRAR